MAAKRAAPKVNAVGVRELRQNLSRYLEQVKDGKTLRVTERGREVARLVPSAPDIHPGYTRLAASYGATIPKGDLLSTIERLDGEGRLGSGAPAGTTDAFLDESRRDRP